ncbi:NAD(P)-dependent oxidoreductase [Runella sp.]|uniref:NAD(P)-dependent oxidoreductase n=1 Tax=Runella sp. TaxID=1960881 RepID=UPI003D0C6174
MKQSKIAVIGGTGKAGKYLVKQLLIQKFPIKILLRNPETFTLKNPLIEIIKGDARDIETIRALVKGCDAVLSTSGQTKGEPVPIATQVTSNVIQAMRENSIQRYILVTGLNVDLPSDQKSETTKMKTEWMRTNFPTFVANRQAEYELLAKSELNWTLVRVPMIEESDERHTVKVDLYDCLGDLISTTDLADFLIGQIADTAFWKKAPFIANG